MPEAKKAEVTERRRVSPVWIVPLAALLIGLWMLVDAYVSQGPQVEIRFPTASAIEPGKTKVKVLDVEVGQVESVRLLVRPVGLVLLPLVERLQRWRLDDELVAHDKHPDGGAPSGWIFLCFQAF